MSITLSERIELCLDRWNALPRQQRSEFASAVTAASLGQAELSKMYRELGSAVDALEERLATAEENLNREPGAGELS